MAQSWLSAPPLIEVAASQQQTAGFGAQLWGITEDYQLISTIQGPPLTPWSPWSKPDWDGAPNQIFGVAACQQGDSYAQIFVLDNQLQLWTAWQSQGGNWSNFAGPNWNGAPPLQRLCASAQGGGQGAQLFGITDKGDIVSCNQATPGSNNWSGWYSMGGPSPTLWITASLQNDPRIQLYALDENQSLWTNFQTAPGNGWAGFEGPNWNAPPGRFQVIATVAQGGTRGAQVWGVDENGALWTCYEQTSGGEWSGWLGPNWADAPTFMRITAAQLDSGPVQFWGLDTNMSLWSIMQQSPGGDWGPWVNS
jgi:hypothetical protein